MKPYYDFVSKNYSYMFNFEEEFEHQDTRVWMTKNWTYGFYYCGIYMLIIFGGQHLMQNRPRFQLRGVLAVWNTCLALFSIIGACRTLPELVYVLKNYGLYHSICVPRLVIITNYLTLLYILCGNASSDLDFEF